MTQLAFIDLETTGLDPDRHDIWEIGVIARIDDVETERLWRVKPNLAEADPGALRVNRYYQRTAYLVGPHSGKRDAERWSLADKVAPDLAVLLDGAHIVGAVPSFDAAFLQRFLRAHTQCPTWHYHLIDVEALAVGYLHGQGDGYRHGWNDLRYEVTRWPETKARGEEIGHLGPDRRRSLTALPDLPWRSDDVSRACGVEPPGDDARHTALGDARWAMRLYDAITGGAS